MEGLEGKVKWLRSMEEGLERVSKEKKPMLLDFFKEG